MGWTSYISLPAPTWAPPTAFLLPDLGLFPEGTSKVSLQDNLLSEPFPLLQRLPQLT